MIRGSARIFAIALLLVVIGCAPVAPPVAPRADGAAPAAVVDQSRVLVIANRSEPDSLSMKAVARVAGLGDTDVPRLFNAGLVIFDERGKARPYLADALPQLSTESWRVFPDGRMETTYRLKPNLTWHDAAPFTADDFVFAWQVYAIPGLGVASAPPINQIEQVSAPDARTLIIAWNQLVPDADILEAKDFQPLPRHLLEEPFRRDQGVAFASHPYWTTEYIGLGPYRLSRWEPGAVLEGTGFAGHVWGRPKIDRVQVRLIADPNAVLANLLAGEAQVAVRNAIQFSQGLHLRREWAANRAGRVLMIHTYWRRAEIQHRPEYANPKVILDIRVRRALAHAIDRQALNDGVYEGEALLADSMVLPSADYFAAVDRVIAKYPYDLRRADQLMTEAGFTRGSDGFFTNPTDGRFSPEMKTNATQDLATELSIMVAGLRQAGFDARETTVPLAQARDGQMRATFPSLYLGGGGVGEAGTLPNFITGSIPSAENRWVGQNRGGWSNPDYDRLFAAFTTTLERPERDRQVVEMARIFTQELGAISYFFYPSLVAHLSAVRGPEPFAAEGLSTWNVHEWEWSSAPVP